jgi:serine/threonine protein kinase
MSPEQIDGQRGDARTDVYALGTILFEMLAGQLPFSGDNNLAVMAQHLNGTAPRLDRINSLITPELAALIARSLARDPADRYADMDAFSEALDHPENVDLSIFLANTSSSRPASLLKNQAFQAIGISLAILVIFVILALVLQTLRGGL